jgi:MATE family multidrug resistance protein
MSTHVPVEASLRGELSRAWQLAWPVSLGMLGLTGMSTVDTLMVGRLGAETMAAVALGSSWFFGLNVVGMGALRALDPVLGQAFGARDEPGLARGMVQGFAMAGLLVVPLVVLQLLAEPGLRLLGQPEHLLPVAATWCQVAAAGVPGWLLFSAARQCLQAVGVVRPATVAILLANLLNILLDWVLIFALGLGPLGAAIATTIGQYALFGFTLWLGWDVLGPRLRAWKDGLKLRPLLGLLALGVPLGAQMAAEAWAFHLAGLMMGWLGELEIAANAVVLNLATLSFMLPFGVSTAAATRVGNLVGAELPWVPAARASLLLGAGVMAGSALAFSLVPQTLARIYTDDPSVIVLVASLLPIAAAFQLFDGIQVVAFGVLRGAGDLRLPSIANLVGYWVLGLPLGGWLAFRAGWGAHGLLTGLAIGVTAVAALLLARVAWRAARGAIRVTT